MRTDGITKKRARLTGRIFATALFLVCLMNIMPILPATAATVEVMLLVKQVFTSVGSSAPINDTFSYRLTPKQASNPMPAGSNADGYTFTIKGTGEKRIWPVPFTKAGTYEYEIRHITDPRTGYVFDQTVFRLEIIVTSDLKASALVYKGNSSEKLAKAQLQYEHTYRLLPSDPLTMVDPPIVKTVSGNPSRASAFTFQLKAGNPANPMPAGSISGVKTVQVLGSGRAEFGTWAYTAEGTYYYTISELTGQSDYTYDNMVYTITDTVTAVNGKLTVTRVVANNANKQVTSCAFINTYKGNGGSTPTPDGKPGGGTGGGSGGGSGGGGSGPKTGDESQVTLYTVLFCTAAVVALGSMVYLLAGKRRRKATK